jgi:hypothetical protein
VEKSSLYRAAAIAAVVAFCCTLIMGFGPKPPKGKPGLQPTHPTGPADDFMYASQEHADKALIFFAADSLFVLSYSIAFLGMYAVAATRSRALAGFGLGAGLLAGALDAIENAFLITYALLAKACAPLPEPALPLIYILANLKWMAAFATFYAFGLVWPRGHWRGWLIAAIMLAFPIVGLLALLFPVLAEIRGAFLLVGMPVFAWDFFARSTGPTP